MSFTPIGAGVSNSALYIHTCLNLVIFSHSFGTWVQVLYECSLIDRSQTRLTLAFKKYKWIYKIPAFMFIYKSCMLYYYYFEGSFVPQ